MSKVIYNSMYVGGELEIVTEDVPGESGVRITYWLNGTQITRHEAQALLDEAKRKAAH